MGANAKPYAHQSEPMTVAEYLALEQETDTKYEYQKGWVRALAGGSLSHAELTGNVYKALSNGLEGSGCKTYNSEAKLYIEASDDFVYPDAMVVCGGIERAQENRNALTNPRLIVEVLSPTTEGYDRGKKFGKYQQVPSLREYLLMAQDEPSVELFTLMPDERSWRFIKVTGLDQEIMLTSLNITLSLHDLYHDVDFSQALKDV